LCGGDLDYQARQDREEGIFHGIILSQAIS